MYIVPMWELDVWWTWAHGQPEAKQSQQKWEKSHEGDLNKFVFIILKWVVWLLHMDILLDKYILMWLKQSILAWDKIVDKKINIIFLTKKMSKKEIKKTFTVSIGQDTMWHGSHMVSLNFHNHLLIFTTIVWNSLISLTNPPLEDLTTCRKSTWVTKMLKFLWYVLIQVYFEGSIHSIMISSVRAFGRLMTALASQPALLPPCPLHVNSIK